MQGDWTRFGNRQTARSSRSAVLKGKPYKFGLIFDVWRARLGSNQQPLPSEGSTLSIELRAHIGAERAEKEAPQDSAFGRKRPSQPCEPLGMTPAATTFRWVFDAGRKAAPRAVPRVKGQSIADIIARYLPEERRGQVCLGRRGDCIAMVFLPSSRSNAAPTHCRRCS